MRWSEFENGLKTEARSFSRSAQAALDEIFAGVSTLKTKEGAPVVVIAGPGAKITSLHRARVFAAEDEKLEEALKYPWIHLGPPPMLAASAGRMNARGISVFYGAIEFETALAEVRPPVGSQVAIAKFTIARPLRLLDVEALKSVTTSGSIFDPQHIRQLELANFLGILSARISRPVMPNEEAFEYLQRPCKAWTGFGTGPSNGLGRPLLCGWPARKKTSVWHATTRHALPGWRSQQPTPRLETRHPSEGSHSWGRGTD
jgi:hypothetical protein